jgi:2-polyprenyl-6-methoxyphenol hydroxylase-like FAD-dependent oxidoreductase
MSEVVVAGGSVAGLATALAFAKRGVEVVVLERSPAPPEGPVAEVAGTWERPSVPQAQHPHTLTSAGVAALRTYAPEVLTALTDAGAVALDLTAAMPPGRPEPDDGDLVALACRRTTLELVLHRLVRELPGVRLEHGVRVDGLRIDGRRVRGVCADGGRRVDARVVVDATGRRARARRWLATAGFPLAPDASTPSGFLGHSRFYRRPGALLALNRGNAAGVVGERSAGVLHPGDNGTFSVVLAMLPEDLELREARHPAVFTETALRTPGLAAWFTDAEPISPVRSTSCPPNLLRTAALAPPVAGLYPVGDAACVTNPLFGRGMSLALRHAFRLAEALGTDTDATGLAGEVYLPWYEQASADDAERIARWRAAITGGRRGTAIPAGAVSLRTAGQAAAHDAVVWRGVTRVLMGLRPPREVFGAPGFAERVAEVGSRR